MAKQYFVNYFLVIYTSLKLTLIWFVILSYVSQNGTQNWKINLKDQFINFSQFTLELLSLKFSVGGAQPQKYNYQNRRPRFILFIFVAWGTGAGEIGASGVGREDGR